MSVHFLLFGFVYVCTCWRVSVHCLAHLITLVHWIIMPTPTNTSLCTLNHRPCLIGHPPMPGTCQICMFCMLFSVLRVFPSMLQTSTVQNFLWCPYRFHTLNETSPHQNKFLDPLNEIPPPFNKPSLGLVMWNEAPPFGAESWLETSPYPTNPWKWLKC